MPDWSNPSDADVAEAKAHGLDLTDPAVQVYISGHNCAIEAAFHFLDSRR
jgi:hypothetical protein